MASVAAVSAEGAKPLAKCAPDAVLAGTICLDKYEASVWRVTNTTTTNKGLVKKITQGKATLADLSKGGATQLGVGVDNFSPCASNGYGCGEVFAVSLPGVVPSARLSWFQAQQACGNARKRLPSNAEWQVAVVGTPDPGPDNGTTDCNTESVGAPVATGSRSACVSSGGAFDMVGNLYEWVSDWIPRSTCSGSWPAEISATGDQQCITGAATTGEPGALARSGWYHGGADNGPFAVTDFAPSNRADLLGVRCAR